MQGLIVSPLSELCDPKNLAILLDVDGTLLDIAARPDDVVVPPDLLGALRSVFQRLSGALALVSGRRIHETDTLFAPLKLPGIGGHGAEMRLDLNGEVSGRHTPPLDPLFKQQLKEIAARHPGVLVEDKGFSVAMHYRLAPKQGVAVAHEIRHAFEAWANPSFELLTGKAVLEIKCAAFDKGSAVRELMAHPPFAGRVPVFIGDDRTDEDAFKVLPEFHGHGVSVGRQLPWVEGHFKSPAEVRQWLAYLSEGVAAEI
jgi:trehalose 6-phosphate phosphatase